MERELFPDSLLTGACPERHFLAACGIGAHSYRQLLDRAREMVDKLEEEPQLNSATGTREFALRDPDGYYVMLSALS